LKVSHVREIIQVFVFVHSVCVGKDSRMEFYCHDSLYYSVVSDLKVEFNFTTWNFDFIFFSWIFNFQVWHVWTGVTPTIDEVLPIWCIVRLLNVHALIHS